MLLRPHHGLCMGFFRGEGYSPEFVAQMRMVIGALEKRPNQLLRLVCREDALCVACPHHTAQGGCASGQRPVLYDRRMLAACGLQEEAQITWQQYLCLIRERVLDAGVAKSICGDCCWAQICHGDR